MDRNEAIEHLKVVLKTCDVQDEEAVEMAITALEQPEIIRCKECRYYEWMSNRVPDEQTWFCHNWNAETGKDDYCSYAERREE